MDPSNAELLSAVLSFPIDDGDPDLPFDARLARENGWPRPYARRVVAEYKRFVYLGVTAGHPVTPSEDVDQAWHLHLTYTRSYWDRLCGGVLGRPLHHSPTRGGAEESAKFRTQYERTLAAYRAAFGDDPPADVWPPADVRFGDDLQAVRVNTARNWVVPKAPARRAAAALAVAAVVVTFGTGCAGAVASPFDLAGPAFLLVLVPAFAAAFALGYALRERLRGPDAAPGDDDLPLDWGDVAYLAGGKDRLTAAAVARLAADGAVRVAANGTDLEAVSAWDTGRGRPPVEAAVVRALPLARDRRAALRDVAGWVEDAFAPRADRLTAAGYLLTPGRRRAARLAGLVPPLAVAILLAMPRLAHGLLTEKPVGFLVVTLLVAAAVAAISTAAMGRLTRRGKVSVARLRAANPGPLAPTPAPDAAGLAVALFGTAAVVGCDSPALAAVGTWYPRQTTDASGRCGSGCGTGCGGGGGCGGGCGGCGGCGGGCG